VDPALINRESSWLAFNARVLSLADDLKAPLLERVKFVGIHFSNLDEFFQVRVAALKDQVAAHLQRRSPDGLTPAEQLAVIRGELDAARPRWNELVLDHLVPALSDEGIELVDEADLSESETKYLDAEFERRIFPVLTPLSVDPGHPFPYISTLSLNLGVMVVDPSGDSRRFARVKVPPLLPRFVALPGGARFVALEQVIAGRLDMLFTGMHIAEVSTFRVTRNADLTVTDSDAEDLLAAIEMELRRRRFGRAVRLEVDEAMSVEMLELLVEELDLDELDVYRSSLPLDLTGLRSLLGLDRPDLRDKPLIPTTPMTLAASADERRSIFSAIRSSDILVHHPYELFTSSVEEFIAQAASDPQVLSIKMTLYRTSGDSPIVHHLIAAAERGVQVAVLVELQARFDEQANIAWAKALERAGVHVVYGMVGLKTHTKSVLVVRSEADGLRRYCHMGTGNYNRTTAQVYEDLGLLTCDPDIGSDLTQLFNQITGFARTPDYRKLIVAPSVMRLRLIDLIANEARHGSNGRIVAKMNSLSDPVVIHELVAAARAGVQIDLIIRGICCLRPGVAGQTETIRVRSIVGRFLEHSRVAKFAHGADGQPVWFMSSADWMGRNLDGRVETMVPIDQHDLRVRLDSMLESLLRDTALSWTLDADGAWHRVNIDGDTNAQAELLRAAQHRARPMEVSWPS
jgi:polyphosphate kinase